MKTPDIERILDGWLGEGTDVLPDRSVEAVLRTVERTSQRSAWRVPWRFPDMNGLPRLATLAGAAIIVVLVAGGLVYFGGSGGPSVGGGLAPSPTASPSPSARPLFPATPEPASGDPLGAAGWTTYHSNLYGFDIGQPPGWTVRPADRRWSFAADATNWLSSAEESLLSPAGDIRVAAWSVPFEPGTGFESTTDFEAWVEMYCQKTNNTPCTGIHERAVPLCLESRDCHPGLLVPFEDDVQAFFTAGIYSADEMIILTIGRGESDPTVTPYGGAQRLLEAFLSTMQVWPESIPHDERDVRDVPIPSSAP